MVDPFLFKQSTQLVLVPSVGCLARDAYPVHAYMGDWRSSLVMEQSFTLRNVFHLDFDLEFLYNRQVELSSSINLSRNRVLSCNKLYFSV